MSLWWFEHSGRKETSGYLEYHVVWSVRWCDMSVDVDA
jgi:hypothetical protein